MTNAIRELPDIASIEVPDELASQTAWLIWKFEAGEEGKKPRKVPYYAKGSKRFGTQGSEADRAKLVTFEEAKAAASRRGFCGVGIAMLGDVDVTALDFDNCFDALELLPDEIHTIAQQTYAEVSPSGKGVRAFVRGNFGNNKSPTNGGEYGFETFHSSGFVTVTGNVLAQSVEAGVTGTIAHVALVEELVRKRFDSTTITNADGDDDLEILDGIGSRHGESIEEIEALLDPLDPDMDRQSWIKVGMALHHETEGDDTGLELWDNWSSAGSKYRGTEDLKTQWDSFERRKGGKGRPITMSTIKKMYNDATGKSSPNGKPQALDSDDPFSISKLFVEQRFTQNGKRCLVRYQEGWWRHVGTHYESYPDEMIEAEVRQFLAASCKQTKDGPAAFKPKSFHVKEVIEGTKTLCCRSDIGFPCWLSSETAWLSKDVISLSNGLLHIPTRTLIPHTPDFFSCSVLPYIWDPNAPEPAAMLNFLYGIYDGDQDQVDTTREMLGYVLTQDTSQQKIFFLIGPPRSGKGTLARLISALLGSTNITSPTLQTMATNFGLQSFIGKQVVLVSDVRVSSKLPIEIVTERLLQISGEDSVTIDRKYRDHWVGQLVARIILMSNEVPILPDGTGALYSRFIVLETKQSFAGREDINLDDRLRNELASIFRWALDGLDRLRKRGHFIQPESSAHALEELNLASNPIAIFVEECCELDPKARVLVADLHNAFDEWCVKNGLYSCKNDQFSRRLLNNFPKLRRSRPRGTGGRQAAVIEGIKLRSGFEGID